MSTDPQDTQSPSPAQSTDPPRRSRRGAHSGVKAGRSWRPSWAVVSAFSVLAFVSTLVVLSFTLNNPAGVAPKNPGQADATAQREASRGFVDAPNQVAPGDRVRAATPRPDKLPPLIRADGACKSALDGIREFQDAHPYGATTFTPEILAQFNALLTRSLPAPAGACPQAVALAFQQQEITPWFSWTAPEAASPVPEPGAGTVARP